MDNQLREVVWTPTTALKPNPKNRNTHTKEQIDRLAKGLENYGWRHPIIVSENSGHIVAGHGRLLAAKQLEWSQVPVIKQSFKNSDEEYGFGVFDNAIAGWAELDMAGINSDLPLLDGANFDIELLGIENFELEPADKESNNYGEQEEKETCETCGQKIRATKD